MPSQEFNFHAIPPPTTKQVMLSIPTFSLSISLKHTNRHDHLYWARENHHETNSIQHNVSCPSFTGV